MCCTAIISGHFLDRGSGIRLHTTAEEKEIKDEIIDSKNIVSPAEKSDNNGEPVITVMSTGTEAEQAEYVSRMISYYINTGEVRFLNYTIHYTTLHYTTTHYTTLHYTTLHYTTLH